MSSSNSAKPASKRPAAILAGICVFAFALTLWWLAKAKWPLGVAGEWQIKPAEGAWPAQAWGLPLAVIFIFGGLAALSAYDRFKRAKSDKERRGSTRLCILGLTIVAFALPWALLGPGGTTNLVSSQFSDISNEYFGTAYQIQNPRDFSRDYATKHQTPQSAVQAHAATHPPGAILFYYFAQRVCESSPFLQSTFETIAVSLTNETIPQIAKQANELRLSAERSAGVKNPDPALPYTAVGAAVWCAFLISLLLASCVPATYFIASIAHSGNSADIDEARGMSAAALLALAPVLSLFAFSLDALIACGAAWTMAFIALRLRGGKPVWLALAGVMMALTSFVSFGALAIGAIAVIALFFAKRESIVKEVGIFATGFVATWLLLMLIFPMQPLAIFLNAMQAHRFATVESRSRGAWLWMNIVSYAVFCGWPLFLAAIGGGFGFCRDALQKRLSKPFNIPVVIGVAALLTMLLLTLSGSAKGEVERLWLFLTPSLATVAAAYLLQRAQWPGIVILLILQAAQTVAMAAWLAPLVLPL
jgi:hypothetical protein